MDKNKVKIEEPFYKYRTVSQCYSKGISLLTDNFRFFFKFLWPVTAICSLLSTLINMVQLFPYHISLPYMEFFKPHISVILAIADMAVFCIFLSYVYTLIKLHASSYDLSKLSFRFFVRESSNNMKTVYALYALMLLAAVLTSVIFPLVYVLVMLVLPCLMLSGKKFWNGIKSGIKLGWFFFFRNLSMFLLLTFTVGVVLVLLNAPVYLFYIYHNSAELSAQAGDIVNTPYIYYYTIPVACFIIFFISFFISIAFYIPTAYLYASAQVAYEKKLTNTGEY